MHRERRALVLMGLASAAALVVVVVFLRTAPARLAAAHPSPTPASQAWHLVNASFGDAENGAIDMMGGGRAATYLTSDGGRTWHTFRTRPAVTTFIDRTHGVTVDLSGSRTFGLSDDAGRTWLTAPQPISLAGAPVEIQPSSGIVGGPFFLDPADGWWFGSLPVSGQPLLWRTLDGGRTWTDVAPAGVVSDPETSLEVQTAFVNDLLGALVIGPERPGAWPSILLTRDGGQTWTPVELAWPRAGVTTGQGTFVVPTLRADQRTLVLELDVVQNPTSGAATPRGHVLSVSDDGGASWGPWATMPSTSTQGAGMAVTYTGDLLLADGRRLWTSPDLGRTWRSLSPKGLPGGVLSVIAAPDGTFFSVVQPPGAAAVALMRSTDGGGGWNEIRLPAAPARR
jgi:photosystem II stability/assembly factor-like uncharacterized protein